MANPAAFEPDPLVTLARWRTVAKVDSIGLVVRSWPCWRVLDVGDYREHGRTLSDPRWRAGLTRFLDFDSSGGYAPPDLIHRFRALLITAASYR